MSRMERIVPPEHPSAAGGPLGELQRQFVREVLYRDSAGLPGRVRTDGLTAERRLGIYRTNARENFALALEAAFPLLLRCLGPEEFRQLAWAYQRACPSPAGNLFHVGRRLPEFLASHLGGTDDEYQIDVARLEWAVQEAMVAADGDEALDLSALAAVPAERQGDIRFGLHPSVRLLRTEYAVFALWEALQAGRAVTPARREPGCLLVLRRAAGVELQRLLATDLAWLESLQAGATLAVAASALPADQQDALGALLVRWVGAGVITSFG
ncbi:MAG: putative DNA-binding domain-containing protein [Chromatiales bacterium]|nr:putative DNA-binding domain-containing protein [Chromatiales bacterium]